MSEMLALNTEALPMGFAGGLNRPVQLYKRNEDGSLFLNNAGEPEYADGVWEVVNKDGKVSCVQVQPRTNATTLPEDAWVLFDKEVVETRKQNLGLADYLMGKGLTFTLDDPLGTTEISYAVVSDIGDATIDMDGREQTQNEKQTFNYRSMPTPVIYKDFEVGIRALKASESSRGKYYFDLVGSQIRNCTRAVAQKIEDLFIGNSEFVVSSDLKVQGLTNYTYRVTGGTGLKKWTTSTITSAELVGHVKAMVDKMTDRANGYNFVGPYTLFIPRAYAMKLSDDYSTAYQGPTIKDKLMQIPGLADIVIVDRMPADNIVLLDTSKDVIEAIKGIPTSIAEYKVTGGWLVKYRVLEMTLPRLKADINGKCGLIHYILTV